MRSLASLEMKDLKLRMMRLMDKKLEEKKMMTLMQLNRPRSKERSTKRK